jgi:leucyl/phenylalanyl-tRNA--protein transferase
MSAYRAGAFPMADAPTGRDVGGGSMIRWYSPDPRAIIELGEGGLHVGRTVARTVRGGKFTLTSDRAFERVIRACARPGPTRGGEWLDETLIRCYTLLHERGRAHSVEAWSAAPAGATGLAGGIYGVSIGAAFFAESMFTAIDDGVTGASSVCLVTLWNHLRACGYELLDVQMANEHTIRFGVVEIPREEYLVRLERAIQGEDRWKALDTGV